MNDSKGKDLDRGNYKDRDLHYVFVLEIMDSDVVISIEIEKDNLDYDGLIVLPVGINNKQLEDEKV